MNRVTTEQRNYERYDLFEFAVIETTDRMDPIRAVVVDIGLGGLQVRARESLSVGQKVRIRVGQSEGPPLELQAEVRYCNSIEGSEIRALGLKFLAATHEERVGVANYVHSVFLRTANL